MRVLGVDSSSSSTGLARVVGEELVEKDVWRPPTTKKKAPDGVRLLRFYRWFDAWVAVRRGLIDMAVVEYLAVQRGARVVRVLSHFEGACLLVLAKHEIVTVQAKAGVARNIVLGMNPNTSKEEVLDEVRRRWPDHDFGVKGRGAEDVADAFVQALAHKEVAEAG